MVGKVKFYLQGGKSHLSSMYYSPSPLTLYLPWVLRKALLLMEKYFANFFWGSTDGSNKYHWSSWHNMCLPKDEGGIGIRKMQDIIDTFSIKRWWRFRTQNSLWATFLRAKYCTRSHPVSKSMVSADSHGWQNILKTRQKVEFHIKWSIQNGSSSFWWDNWTGDGPLAHQVQGIRKSAKTQVKEFLTKWAIGHQQVKPGSSFSHHWFYL